MGTGREDTAEDTDTADVVPLPTTLLLLLPAKFVGGVDDAA